MRQHVRQVFQCVVAMVVVAVGVLMFGQTQPSAQQPAARPQASTGQAAVYVRMLNQPMDTKDLQQQNLTLGVFVKPRSAQLQTMSPDATVLVDFEAFKNVNPDIYKEESDLYDIKVRMQPGLKRLPIVSILREAVKNFPTGNATFVLRRGVVEITTNERTYGLIWEKFVATFDRRPLLEAVQELSHITGASINIDPRVGDKRDTPVTATFLNDVPLKNAVDMLADMAGLRVVPFGEFARDVGDVSSRTPVITSWGLYVTTPENANVIRQDQNKQLQEELWRKKMVMPEVGPPPPAGRKGEPAAALLRPGYGPGPFVRVRAK